MTDSATGPWTEQGWDKAAYLDRCQRRIEGGGLLIHGECYALITMVRELTEENARLKMENAALRKGFPNEWGVKGVGDAD